MGWGGVVGEVGNKANTAQLVVEVKVRAELGNIESKVIIIQHINKENL